MKEDEKAMIKRKTNALEEGSTREHKGLQKWAPLFQILPAFVFLLRIP